MATLVNEAKSAGKETVLLRFEKVCANKFAIKTPLEKYGERTVW